MYFELEGKVAVVTGPRTGIGQACAVALAKSGAKIFGVGHNPMPETKAIIESVGGSFTEYIADLSKTDSVMAKDIIRAAVKEYGHVDILVNNAGIARNNPAEEFTEEDWNYVIACNQTALWFLSQAVGQYFLQNNVKGKIVNIASMLSYTGGVNVVSYTASKHAVMGITRALSNEWAKYGININAIAPGYIISNNTQFMVDDPVLHKEVLDRIPCGRWGVPDDIGEPVAFLCSDAAHYINGFTLAVDGGWLGR